MGDIHLHVAIKAPRSLSPLIWTDIYEIKIRSKWIMMQIGSPSYFSPNLFNMSYTCLSGLIVFSTPFPFLLSLHSLSTRARCPDTNLIARWQRNGKPSSTYSAVAKHSQMLCTSGSQLIAMANSILGLMKVIMDLNALNLKSVTDPIGRSQINAARQYSHDNDRNWPLMVAVYHRDLPSLSSLLLLQSSSRLEWALSATLDTLVSPVYSATNLLDNMLRAIFGHSYTKIPNHIPLSQGITSRVLLCFFLFFCVKSFLVTPAVIGLFIFCTVNTKGNLGPLYGSTTSGGAFGWFFMYAINAGMGNNATYITNQPDMTR
ncbi:hypothetical protein BDZ45DRAFT_798820 [Acephala macrosclerotiorum]|nr:hypothetical protein BDZ45DRAFT_798820 [Acephala macrosclerotiorum]